LNQATHSSVANSTDSRVFQVLRFRYRGGMPLFMSSPISGRYLSFAEREEIALLSAQDIGVREIARRIGQLATPNCPADSCMHCNLRIALEIACNSLPHYIFDICEKGPEMRL
jgi:hypothetical protein